ncbi:MAG: hypothetical protein F7B60_01290 [Desulfurococcales archaeon]|nr:hypothetical protein [Desulfurococcales archaeon]
MIRKCSICGKRGADLYRSSSGEYICSKCLEKVVVKNVKKTLGKTRRLTTGMNILIYGTWLSPIESLISMRIVPRVESKYKTKISIIIPGDMLNYTQNLIKSQWSVSTYNYRFKGKQLAECVLEDIENARKIGLESGFDVVITPYSRLLLIKAGLQAILAGRKDLIKASRPFHDTGPLVISALFGLEKELILKYAFIRGLPLLEPKHSCNEMGSGNILFNLLKDSHEVEFNSLRTLEILAEFAETGNHSSFISSSEEEH